MIHRIKTSLSVGLLILAFSISACDQEHTGNRGQEAAVVGSLSADTLLSAPPANALILDVRTSEEFASGHVPGAINIPYDEVGMRVDELGSDLDRTVVVYCERGGRAGKAEATLLAAGFTDLMHLEGDMLAWRSEGRPTIKP